MNGQLVFRNKNFKRRDYECTNIVACVVLGENLPDSKNWVRDPFYPIENLTPLYIENNIRYYGYL